MTDDYEPFWERAPDPEAEDFQPDVRGDPGTVYEWFDAFIEHLDEQIIERERWGLWEARNIARQVQLAYLPEADCECPGDESYPGQVDDFEWKCFECEASLFLEPERTIAAWHAVTETA